MAEKQRRHKAVPPGIRRIVDSHVPVIPYLQLDLDAFYYLNRSRPIFPFGGFGPIDEQSILAYVLLRGYEPGSQDVDDLVRNIRVLDDEYLLIEHEKHEAKKKAEEEAKKKKKGRS